jgi:hypothetical protein
MAVGLVSTAAVAGSTPVPQTANNGATAPSLSLAIGQKGDPEIAAIGKHATLLYYTIVRGKWRRTQVAGPGTAQSGPSLVGLPGGKAAIAVEGPNNSLLLFTLRNGHWTRQMLAGATSTYSAPSLADGPLGLALAVEGSDNTLWFYYVEKGQWRNQEALGDQSAYSAPSLVMRGIHRAVFGDPASEADIAVEGSDHDLIYASAITGLTTWNATAEDGGAALAYSAPSLLVTDGADVIQGLAFIAVEGPHHRIVIESVERGTGFTYNSATTNNTVYSAPSITQNLADGRRPIVIAYQGRASKVFDLVVFYSSTGSAPMKYDQVGSVHADSAPAAAAGAPKASTDDVIVEGAGNTLWYFDGAKPGSKSAVPKFLGTEIGGGGSTFGG